MMEGETINLTDGEKKVLALGPKFCVRKHLDEEEFMVEVEECITKVRWERMGEEIDKKKRKNSADIAIMSILDEEQVEEVEEHESLEDAKLKMIYHPEEKSWSFGRRKATDVKGNTMVILPGMGKNFQEEANYEMLRTELRGCFKEYKKKYCNKKGEQESNLSKEENLSLKSLKKRFKTGEIIILPTDKSGRFGVMSQESYIKAGGKHTDKDDEVDLNVVMKTQNELNGDISMLIKVFKMGKRWKHGDRVRTTMINKSLSLCPMYLTFKDHKGWTGGDGSPPPTRPIAGGNIGMNLHLSEVISEMVEPLVDACVGGDEIISSEDLKARMEGLNEKNEGWVNYSWWEGKTIENGNIICCTKCIEEGDKKTKDEDEYAHAPSARAKYDDKLGDDENCEGDKEMPKYAHAPSARAKNGDELDESRDDNAPSAGVKDDVNCEGIPVELAGGKTGTIYERELCQCDSEVVDKWGNKVDEWEEFWETPEGQDPAFWTLSEEDFKQYQEDKLRKMMRRVKPKAMKRLRRREWEDRQAEEDLEDLDKRWKSKDMNKEDIQDFETAMVVIGCDVEALYPSLDAKRCSEIVRDEVMRSSITWEDIDYLEGTRFIALNKSAEYCRNHPLRRVLPVRRGRTGSRPGVTGKGPMGPNRGDQEQWVWHQVTLTPEEKKMIVAEVMKITTEVMFSTHLYTFGGKVHRQRKGGPIGLRGTCAIARLVMCAWDRCWKEAMVTNSITIEGYWRYMDDGRIFLHAIKRGWRWVDGELIYTRRWAIEDKNKSPVEITRAAMEGSLQDIFTFLKFTTEVGEGEGNWLPTLDMMIRVEDSNIISYNYFEKPTTTNVMVQKRSALGENTKVQILSNELVRRMGNTDVRLGNKVMTKVIDQFGKKLLTSGYTLSQSRKIALSGIRGWERKLKRAEGKIRSLFRTSEESMKGRIRKKAVGKTTWYKKRKKDNIKEDKRNRTEESTTRKHHNHHQPSTDKERTEYNHDDSHQEGRGAKKTAAVLFIENTKEGKLAQNIREVLERLEGMLGYKIKVVERAGTPLRLMFPLSKVGEGKECGREDCTTCTQESRSETLPPCNKRSVLYENICTKCNPGVGEKNFKLSPPEHPPSVYIGESARSLYERGGEHWRDFRNNQDDSHIYKHHHLHHGGEGEPSFHLRPVKFLGTALKRQISEAVRIEILGEDRILNSKGEYNRCRIGRLTVGDVGENKTKEGNKDHDEEEESRGADKVYKDWESRKIMDRRAEELQGRVDLTRGLMVSPARKRRGEKDKLDSAKKRNTRKLQHPVLQEDWGEEGTEGVPPPPTSLANLNIPPPLPPPPPMPSTMTTTMPSTNQDSPTTTNHLRGEVLVLLPPSKHQTPPKPSQIAMEDDIQKSKDDLLKEDDLGQQPDQIQEVKMTSEESKKEDDLLSRMVAQPPPPTERMVEGVHPRTGDHSDHHDEAPSTSTGSRGESQDVPEESNEYKEDIPPDINTNRRITVNGVDLMDIMKRKAKEGDKKTGNKKGRGQKEGGNKKSTTPSSEQNGQMLRYLVGNKPKQMNRQTDRQENIDNTDSENKSDIMKTTEDNVMKGDMSTKNEVSTDKNMKTTFSSLVQSNVRMKINRFEAISMKNKCVLGNGRCDTHNCKLVRDIVVRRTSQYSKDEELSWTRKDTVRMCCPATSQQVADLTDVTTLSNNTELGGSNKRTRFTTHGEENQSEASIPILERDKQTD